MIRNPFLQTRHSETGGRGLVLGLVALVFGLALLIASSPIGSSLGVPVEARSGLRLSAGLLGFVAAAYLFGRGFGRTNSARERVKHLVGSAILSAAATLFLAGFLDGLLGAAR